MADLKKLKKHSGYDPLGGAEPPARVHAPGNVTAPETFELPRSVTPARQVTPADHTSQPAPSVPTREAERSAGTLLEHRVRTLLERSETVSLGARAGHTGGKGRRTGRVHQLGTRFTAEFVERVHELSNQTGIKINALLEQALAVWERERQLGKK